MSPVRRTANRLSSRAISLAAGRSISDVQTGFRLYTRVADRAHRLSRGALRGGERGGGARGALRPARGHHARAAGPGRRPGHQPLPATRRQPAHRRRGAAGARRGAAMSEPVTLVTGGSRGIGRAMVEPLVAEGWPVAFTYRTDDAAARLVTEGSGGRAHALRARPRRARGARRRGPPRSRPRWGRSMAWSTTPA